MHRTPCPAGTILAHEQGGINELMSQPPPAMGSAVIDPGDHVLPGPKIRDLHLSAKLQLFSGHTAEQSLAIYRTLTLSDVAKEYEASMRTFPVRLGQMTSNRSFPPAGPMRPVGGRVGSGAHSGLRRMAGLSDIPGIWGRGDSVDDLSS
jgi:hypothetical protein